jgi:hypothetical protein
MLFYIWRFCKVGMLQKCVGSRLLEATDYLWQSKTWECDAECTKLVDDVLQLTASSR